MKNLIPKLIAGASIMMGLISIFFSVPLGLGEPTAEGYGIVGIVIGSSTTYLFLSTTKDNGTHIATNREDNS